MGASDYMVGNAPQGASYSAPLVGFQLGQSLADLPEEYFKGTQRKRALAMQKPILDPETGQPTQDPNTIISELQKRGGAEYSEKLLPFIYGSQLMRQNAGLQPPSMGEGAPGAPNISNAAGPGNISQPAAQPRQPMPQGQPRLAAAGGDIGNGPGADNIRSLVTGLAGGREAGSAIRDAVQKFRIGPDADLSPEQVKAVTAFIGPKLRGGAPSEDASADAGANAGSPPPFMGGSSGLPKIPAGGQAPNAAAQAGGGMANVDPAGGAGGPPTAAEQWRQRTQAAPPDPATGLPPGWNETAAASWEKYGRAKANLSLAAGTSKNPGMEKQLMSEADHAFANAKMIREAMKDRAGFTGEQKNARDEAVNRSKVEAKLGEEVATAKGKRIGEVVEAGGLPARQMVNNLNVMEDALKQGGTNISTGPGAEGWLKVKQVVKNIFPDFVQGVTESETVQKLNAQLAAASAKAMTQRPSQLEFRAFMANNPGLLTSIEGSKVLINILRQAKEQDMALSRKAYAAKNYDNWPDVEDQFYKENPIKSPFTGKPLTGDPRVDGGATAAGKLAAPKIGDVHGDHRYLGGDPHNAKSWAPISQADRT